eukprot:PhF_6_TR20467/c0_g1_i1/m.29435
MAHPFYGEVMMETFKEDIGEYRFLTTTLGSGAIMLGNITRDVLARLPEGVEDICKGFFSSTDGVFFTSAHCITSQYGSMLASIALCACVGCCVLCFDGLYCEWFSSRRQGIGKSILWWCAVFFFCLACCTLVTQNSLASHFNETVKLWVTIDVSGSTCTLDDAGSTLTSGENELKYVTDWARFRCNVTPSEVPTWNITRNIELGEEICVPFRPTFKWIASLSKELRFGRLVNSTETAEKEIVIRRLQELVDPCWRELRRFCDPFQFCGTIQSFTNDQVFVTLPIARGMSGSPCVNHRNEVVGIVQGYSSREKLNVCARLPLGDTHPPSEL